MSFGAVAGAVLGGATIYGITQQGEVSKKMDKRAQQRASEDFSRRSGEWKAYWEERLPRMTEVERRAFDKINSFINKYQPLVARSFKEQDQEKIYREYINDVSGLTGKQHEEVRADIEQLRMGERDPAFAQRVTEAEHERRRDYAEDLKQYFGMEQRQRARGGAAGISPERRDEAMSRAMARFQDESRAGARKQVEDTLSTLLGHKAQAGQAMLEGKRALIPQYGDLAQSERARIEGALGAEMGLEGQRIAGERAYSDAIDRLLSQQYADKPQFQQPESYYQPVDRGQQIIDYTQAGLQTLGAFGSLWDRSQAPRRR